ncbi:MAG: glycosyltransferase family 9 protein [Candidatus Kapabacteria bacterium]|nr:glycosyltransferase family 9 protein [Candidatus Kapabacteria bacterium]
MNIGIIQLGRIGDMVLMTPLFDEIKKLFPDSKLHVFAGPSNNSIIGNNPAIDNIHLVKKTPLGIIRTVFELNYIKYDFWIDPKDHFSKESRIIASIVNSKCKIGYNHPEMKKVFDISLQNIESLKHHSLISLSPLLNFNFKLPEKPPKPVLYTQNDSDIYTRNFLVDVGDEYVVLNISGSAEHKMWDNSCWLEFLSKADIKLPVVLTFAPSESRRAEELQKVFPALKIFKSRNINDIVSLVSKCKFIITPDTAIVHIAAAFNKPVFALYSGMDDFYIKFHPLSDIYKTVRAEKGDKGIKSIRIEDTLNEFSEFMSELI